MTVTLNGAASSSSSGAYAPVAAASFMWASRASADSQSAIATQGPGQDGFLGSTRYGVLAEPDVLVEIADWESAEARDAHMKEAAATGAYAPLLELLAAPFRVTVISQLP